MRREAGSKGESKEKREEEVREGEHRERPPRDRRIWVGPHVEMTEDFITLNAIGSRRGDAAEAEFMARACGMDFRVAKPWGNIDPYDVLLGMGQGFWRVQVKCAHSKSGGSSGSYQAPTMGSGSKEYYSKNEIDFLAAWVVQRNIWYIVPVEAFEGVTSIGFYPGKKLRRPGNRMERYREAWCLLTCPPKARGWEDIPVKCRCRELPVRCAVCPERG